MSKDIGERLRDEFELDNLFCSAILLAFEENIIYDYPIPDSYFVVSALQYALGKICGVKRGDELPWQHGGNVHYCALAHPERIEERILEGLKKVTHSPKDTSSILEGFLENNRSRFGHEWFCGRGDFYRWRDGKRQIAITEAHISFTHAETKCWDRIRKHMRDYVAKKYTKDGREKHVC